MSNLPICLSCDNFVITPKSCREQVLAFLQNHPLVDGLTHVDYEDEDNCLINFFSSFPLDLTFPGLNDARIPQSLYVFMETCICHDMYGEWMDYWRRTPYETLSISLIEFIQRGGAFRRHAKKAIKAYRGS